MRKIAVGFLLTVLFLNSFSLNGNAIVTSEVDQGLGLAVMGEGNGAYYAAVVNQTVQGFFIVKNIGTIMAECSISEIQSSGPLGCLDIDTKITDFNLYPQESIKVYFFVKILLNTSDLMSVDWKVTGVGEERDEEGSSTVSVSIVCRANFQILGYSGILTIETVDQNNNPYDGLICQVRRDFLLYANKSTRDGEAEFLLSIPANYSVKVFKDSTEVYNKQIELTGDRRIQILVRREFPQVPEFHILEFGLGFFVGYLYFALQGKWKNRKKEPKPLVPVSESLSLQWELVPD